MIIKISSFKSNAKLTANEIACLINEGYLVSRLGKNICISIDNGRDIHKYLLRPKTTDNKVFKQVIIQGEYIPIVDLIETKGQSQFIKRIIDAGSNIGMTSLFFKKFYPDAQIISIEPDKENFSQQKLNIKINGYNSSIKPLRGALWGNNSDRLLISNKFRDGGSWAKSVIVSNRVQNIKLITSLTLKDVVEQFGEKVLIDILKIDIEGSEASLFESRDFIEVLMKSVKFLCIEIHDELGIRKNIDKVLSEINFSNYQVGETCFCVNNNLVY